MSSSFLALTQLTFLPDRKPVDPPPVVQLKIKRDADPEQSYLQSTRPSETSSLQRTDFLNYQALTFSYHASSYNPQEAWPPNPLDHRSRALLFLPFIVSRIPIMEKAHSSFSATCRSRSRANFHCSSISTRCEKAIAITSVQFFPIPSLFMGQNSSLVCQSQHH
jgi:hypothetical protein